MFDWILDITWIYHVVTPLNPAADEFTRQRIVDEDGLFCFSMLAPIPRILTKTQNEPNFVVSAEELRQFKEEYGPRINTTYEPDGLLFVENDYGVIWESHCTPECAQMLQDKYGVTNMDNFIERYWVSDHDGQGRSKNEDGAYQFFTPNRAPFEFMKIMAQACPQGHWKWQLFHEEFTEGINVEIKDGAVFLEDHWINLHSADIDDRKFDDDSDLFWRDALYWNGDEGVARALSEARRLQPGGVYTAQLHHKL